MDHLRTIGELKNRYYLMRHGQSKANAQGKIISHPIAGTSEAYTLTPLGEEQARQSAERSNLPQETIIYASDFSRAKRTAEIVREVLGAQPIHVTPLLRERFFGDWEAMDGQYYDTVWRADKDSADHTEANVESVRSVLERVTRLIGGLEEKYHNQTILLVSHGDTLQILQTAFERIDPTHHRNLTHLETAEIREVALVSQQK